MHEHLQECVIGLPQVSYTQGPWLEFENESGRRWCQPDGLLVCAANRAVTVVEVKYRHTSDAWWQLWRLYIPVVRILYTGYLVNGLEIVKWFDPQTAFPAPFTFTASPLTIPSNGVTAVHIYNPQRG